MKSLRSLEGEMVIEHRFSPGVPGEVMLAIGLPADAGKRDTVWESAVATCNHCENQVVMNPDRSRERYVCLSCTHYICDECQAQRFLGKPCYPFKAKVADHLEAVDKGIDPQVAYEAIFVRGERLTQAVVLLDAPISASQVFQSPLILP